MGYSDSTVVDGTLTVLTGSVQECVVHHPSRTQPTGQYEKFYEAQKLNTRRSLARDLRYSRVCCTVQHSIIERKKQKLRTGSNIQGGNTKEGSDTKKLDDKISQTADAVRKVPSLDRLSYTTASPRQIQL